MFSLKKVRQRQYPGYTRYFLLLLGAKNKTACISYDRWNLNFYKN